MITSNNNTFSTIFNLDEKYIPKIANQHYHLFLSSWCKEKALPLCVICFLKKDTSVITERTPLIAAYPRQQKTDMEIWRNPRTITIFTTTTSTSTSTTYCMMSRTHVFNWKITTKSNKTVLIVISIFRLIIMTASSYQSVGAAKKKAKNTKWHIYWIVRRLKQP